MRIPDPKETALGLIQRHGLRAQAMAVEHAAEAQAAGDTAGAARWQRVQEAVAELRRTGRLADERRAANGSMNAAS